MTTKHPGINESSFLENWMVNGNICAVRPTFEDFRLPGTFFCLKEGIWIGMVLEFIEQGKSCYPGVKALFFNNMGRKGLEISSYKLDSVAMDAEYRFIKPKDAT